MYLADAATGKVVDYLSRRGGYSTKSNRSIADELGLNYGTVKEAIHRLQKSGRISRRDEDNRLNLITAQ